MDTSFSVVFQLFEYPLVKLIVLLFVSVIVPIFITIIPLAIWNNLSKIKDLMKRNVELLESIQESQKK